MDSRKGNAVRITTIVKRLNVSSYITKNREQSVNNCIASLPCRNRGECVCIVHESSVYIDDGGDPIPLKCHERYASVEPTPNI